MPKTAPYGSWKSPITAEMASVAPVPFVGLAVEGRDLYWVECRPQEGGRYVIMRQDSDGNISACTPQGFNVRSTVHEYGGGAFAVSRGTIYFVNFQDQRLYVQPPGGSPPQALTPEGKFRYADMILDHARQRLICVREDHTGPGEAVNTLVAVDLSGGKATVLASGNDFYSNPRLSPDGTRLAYLTWNHPNMPWDGCELRVAPVE